MRHIYNALDMTAEDVDTMLKVLCRLALIQEGSMAIDTTAGKPWFRITPEMLNAIACDAHKILNTHCPQNLEETLRKAWYKKSRENGDG